MRRTICKIMGAVMIMSLIWSAPSVTASDRSESQNITSVRTPINDKKGGTVWTRSFSVDGTLTYNSTPVITDDAIYLVSGNTLYELDLDGNIKRQMALAATGKYFVDPTVWWNDAVCRYKHNAVLVGQRSLWRTVAFVCYCI